MKRFLAILPAVLAAVLFAFPAHADVLGDQKVFTVDPQYDARGRQQINVTLQGVSGHAYIYVADDYWNLLTADGRSQVLDLIRTVGNEFDARLYPIETSFFGSEPSPGIDQDTRTTLVFTRLSSSVGGYFDSANSYPRSEVASSNERDMIYLNAPQFNQASRLLPFLAHEFQHLISFNQKEVLRGIIEDVWLNEARSEYAITLAGLNTPFSGSTLSYRLSTFLQKPSDSLTEWQNQLIDYGVADAFDEYLTEHWPARILGDSGKSTLAGIPSINEALRAAGSQQTFTDVFQYWMAANILNDTSKNPFFGYTNPSLASFRVAPTQSIGSITTGGTTISIPAMKAWEQRWYNVQLSPGGGSYMHVAFSSSAMAKLRVSYLLFSADGTNTLQSADVSQGDHTLHIQHVGDQVTRVVLMPYLRDERAGFGSQETASTVTMSLVRDDIAPPVTTSLIPGQVNPEYFSLHEGDFIQAVGDKDVYIINEYGYKRIVLSPTICLLYAHLGARGCFDAIHKVTPDVRDAFITSPYYSNGYTKDGIVYKLIITGEDSAYLVRDPHPLDNSVFFINDLEQRAYGQ